MTMTALALLESTKGIMAIAVPCPPPPIWQIMECCIPAIWEQPSLEVRPRTRTFRRVIEGEKEIYLYVEEA